MAMLKCVDHLHVQVPSEKEDEADPARSVERNFYQERFFVRDPGGNQLEIMGSGRPHSAGPKG